MTVPSAVLYIISELNFLSMALFSSDSVIVEELLKNYDPETPPSTGELLDSI